jgi:hypothetical protein
MNIFYLSNCPQEAAEAHNDKHCVKMILESAQMLSTAHRELDGNNVPDILYKSTHKNHPSTIWARSSKQHYNWLFRLFRMLSAEYSIRYSEHNFKVHKTWDKLGKILETAPKNIKDNGWVEPPQCMPDHCKRPNTIDAYRNYYMTEKASISRWKYSNQPTWWTV